jgi:hypothetical protein
MAIARRTWLGLGVSMLAADAGAQPACDANAMLHAARRDRAAQGGGEAGEGGGENGGPPGQRLAFALYSLDADLLAGDLALAAARPDEAAELYGFALDEGYHRVAAPLREAGIDGFEHALAALAEAATPARRQAAQAALDAAIARAGQGTAEARLDLALLLLNRASADYALSVACDRIEDVPAAWQARAAAERGAALGGAAAAGLAGKDAMAAADFAREVAALLAALPARPVQGQAAPSATEATATVSRAMLAAGELMR